MLKTCPSKNFSGTWWRSRTFTIDGARARYTVTSMARRSRKLRWRGLSTPVTWVSLWRHRRWIDEVHQVLRVNALQAFEKCFIGCNQERDLDSVFCGQMSSLYLFSEALAPHQIASIYVLGAAYKVSHSIHLRLVPSRFLSLLLSSLLMCRAVSCNRYRVSFVSRTRAVCWWRPALAR